jgi:hypothetical protein
MPARLRLHANACLPYYDEAESSGAIGDWRDQGG